MIIRDLIYSGIALKLRTPFKNSKTTIYAREGFIISLKNENNFTGYGECSPLPGFSYESLLECEEQLQKLSMMLNNLNIGDDLKAFENFINKRNLYPSVKFALEQALFNLLILENPKFISKKFGLTRKEIDVNAVLGISNKMDLIAEIERKISLGYETFKIKIGSDKFDNDFKLIDSIRKYFGEGINLRVDVNGAWSRLDTIDRIKYLSPFNLQFIEEPYSHLDSLIKIAKNSMVPIGADESINTSSDVLNVIKSSSIEFIVLKPMIISGLFSAIKLIEEASKKKKKIIISSSFESVVGKSALVFLAALTNHKYSHGLDTEAHFDKNLCHDTYEVKNGKINFDPDTFPPNFDLLFKLNDHNKQ